MRFIIIGCEDPKAFEYATTRELCRLPTKPDCSLRFAHTFLKAARLFRESPCAVAILDHEHLSRAALRHGALILAKALEESLEQPLVLLDHLGLHHVWAPLEAAGAMVQYGSPASAIARMCAPR